MDELLEELGTSYNDLYKIHTGHEAGKESDDNCSSDDSSSIDETNKPPPYSIEEIKRNVSSKAQKDTETNGKPSSANILEELSTKLSSLITDKYCFICNKLHGRHYSRPQHYRNVMMWLEKKLINNISTEVKLYNIFCEVCNLALCGNNLAQDHYKSEDHLMNAQNFCLPCLRSVPETSMPSHLQSKQHKRSSKINSRFIQKSKLKIKLEQQCGDNKISDLNHKSEFLTEEQQIGKFNIAETKEENFKNDQNMDNNIARENVSNIKSCENDDSELKFTGDNDLKSSKQNKTLTDHQELANIIMDALTPSICYVCNTRVQGSHYNCKEHNQALEMWINSYAKSKGICLQNMDDLICFACHAIFPSKKYAESHYEAQKHLSKSKMFCNVCLQHLVNRQAIDHYTQPEHKTLESAKKADRKRKQEIIIVENHAINPTHSESFITQKEKNLKIHGIDVNVIKVIHQNNMDETVMCNPNVKLIIELMTPVYCFICNKSALKNRSGQFKHYTYESHLRELKKLLPPKENTFGSNQISYESVYCEACNEIFLNDKLATNHYNASQHQWNCSNMHIVKSPTGEIGQNETLVLGNTIESGFTVVKEQEIYPLATNLQNMVPSKKIIQTVIRENCPDARNKNEPGIIIAQKLKDMISPIFCPICKKNINMHICDHYLERQHTVKLRNWLDKEIKKFRVKIDKNIIYCEDCSLELGGTNEDLKHYETISHQLNKDKYCSICIFRGTSSDVIQHLTSNYHKDNLKKNLTNTIKGNTSWPKKLTKLIKFTECKICYIKLDTAEKADFHYCSERHNSNVKNWLDRFHQFGDNLENNNSSMFSCTFCDSIFTSEEELKGHKNSHFPKLGRTIGDHSYPSPRAQRQVASQINQSQKQIRKVPEGVTSDKPTLLIPHQHEYQSVLLENHPHKNHNNGKENNMKYYEEIRIEINKLINTVYLFKQVPLKQSLRHLKELNQKLVSFKRSNVQNEKPFEKSYAGNEGENSTVDVNSWDLQEAILNCHSTSRDEEIMGLEFLNMTVNRMPKVAEQEYAKTKLSMETRRLNLVLGNESKIPLHLAFTFAQNFNRLLDNLVKSGSREFDIDDAFQDVKNEFIKFSKTSTRDNLQDELDKLSRTLLVAREIEVGVALDFITQFNVQLESFLHYQNGNDSLYYYLSD